MGYASSFDTQDGHAGVECRSGLQPHDSLNASLDEPQLSAISSSHSSQDNLELTNGDTVSHS